MLWSGFSDNFYFTLIYAREPWCRRGPQTSREVKKTSFKITASCNTTEDGWLSASTSNRLYSCTGKPLFLTAMFLKSSSNWKIWCGPTGPKPDFENVSPYHSSWLVWKERPLPVIFLTGGISTFLIPDLHSPLLMLPQMCVSMVCHYPSSLIYISEVVTTHSPITTVPSTSTPQTRPLAMVYLE